MNSSIFYATPNIFPLKQTSKALKIAFYLERTLTSDVPDSFRVAPQHESFKAFAYNCEHPKYF